MAARISIKINADSSSEMVQELTETPPRPIASTESAFAAHANLNFTLGSPTLAPEGPPVLKNGVVANKLTEQTPNYRQQNAIPTSDLASGPTGPFTTKSSRYSDSEADVTEGLQIDDRL